MSIVRQGSIAQTSYGSVESPAFSAVITLYNEERSVEPLTRNLMSAFLKEFPHTPFEIVLVLNGPLDRTAEIARGLGHEFKEITLVALSQNQGYGGGLLAGLSNARSPVIGIFDGDEQIDSSDAARIFAVALSASYDLVKAKRTSREDGWQRIVITKIYNLLFGIMFGKISSDINGKPKVMKRASWERLNLTATDWFIDAEIMLEAARLRFSLHEIPVLFRRRKAGSSNVRPMTLVEFLRNMWKYWHA